MVNLATAPLNCKCSVRWVVITRTIAHICLKSRWTVEEKQDEDNLNPFGGVLLSVKIL